MASNRRGSAWNHFLVSGLIEAGFHQNHGLSISLGNNLALLFYILIATGPNIKVI